MKTDFFLFLKEQMLTNFYVHFFLMILLKLLSSVNLKCLFQLCANFLMCMGVFGKL